MKLISGVIVMCLSLFGQVEKEPHERVFELGMQIAGTEPRVGALVVQTATAIKLDQVDEAIKAISDITRKVIEKQRKEEMEGEEDE